MFIFEFLKIFLSGSPLPEWMKDFSFVTRWNPDYFDCWLLLYFRYLQQLYRLEYFLSLVAIKNFSCFIIYLFIILDVSTPANQIFHR